MSDFPIGKIRAEFPGLEREVDGEKAIFFDGPGGSQVPKRVAGAVCKYLLDHNANVGMSFETSKETDLIIAQALEAAADFVGSQDPREMVFGQNMTSL
ncbi:MAG: aminotransferase class V-fold PLP-dependent enzyme, partial [Candidatus Thermoplasmatota archaeon]|nr:aminotransferase class V-fold PLP-dependent enzyme [Candidatus Thermoplasmatota archaeon]